MREVNEIEIGKADRVYSALKRVSKKGIESLTQDEIPLIYLDYFNNFLTIGRFAEIYKIKKELARKVIDFCGKEYEKGISNIAD